ncbi:hypothetical protein BJF78_34175 [Pseudonocardia sp. CNS-139]|nr:hypothetical protein BJF78_34175 [Pseudonocardia sp. CNS-139]
MTDGTMDLGTVGLGSPIPLESLPTSPLPSPPLAIALQKAVALLESLSREELAAIASGDAHLVYRPAPRAARRREAALRQSAVDVTAAVADINRLATPADVEAYLHRRDAELTVAVLKEIARALGPTVTRPGAPRPSCAATSSRARRATGSGPPRCPAGPGNAGSVRSAHARQEAAGPRGVVREVGP